MRLGMIHFIMRVCKVDGVFTIIKDLGILRVLLYRFTELNFDRHDQDSTDHE